MIELNSEGRPLSAAQLRRLEKAKAKVRRWWDAIPDADKPAMVRPWAIVEGTDTPTEQLAPALRRMGWQRVQYREHRGDPRIYWIPPGFPNPVRPVGRPPGRPGNRKLPGERRTAGGAPVVTGVTTHANSGTSAGRGTRGTP